MKKNVWNPTAAEKLAMEKDDGVVILKEEKLSIDKCDIKMTVEIDGEIREHELSTLFFVGIDKDNNEKEDGQTVNDLTCGALGNFDQTHSQSIVAGVHTLIDRSSQLTLADLKYHMSRVRKFFGDDK